MVAKFLDLDREGHLHFQTMEEKYGLPFCSWEQSCTGRTVYMSFLCHVGRTSVYWDPEILPPWQRDVATSVSIRKETCFPLVRLLRFSLNKFNVIITRIIGVRTKHWPGVHGSSLWTGSTWITFIWTGSKDPLSWTGFMDSSFFQQWEMNKNRKSAKIRLKKQQQQQTMLDWSVIFNCAYIV